MNTVPKPKNQRGSTTLTGSYWYSPTFHVAVVRVGVQNIVENDLNTKIAYALKDTVLKMVSKLSEIWSGLFIPDPDPDFLPISDPGVKKAPDPGSGSATLAPKRQDLDQSKADSYYPDRKQSSLIQFNRYEGHLSILRGGESGRDLLHRVAWASLFFQLLHNDNDNAAINGIQSGQIFKTEVFRICGFWYGFRNGSSSFFFGYFRECQRK